MNKLELNNVSVIVDKHVLLNNINLTLAATGITTIMGYNGAGKSVLLKTMHAIMQPSQGSINWTNDERDIKPPVQAMVFQKPVLLRRTTAANIDFAIQQRPNTMDSNQRTHPQNRTELLDSVGLKEKAAIPARRLSGGEQQRLTLARALAMQPEVLFLDEPTASLDPASTAIIEKIVLQQARSGTAVFMVTHDAAQAERLADNVIFLHEGRVVEQNKAKHFFVQPNDSKARAYLDGRLLETHQH